MQECLTMLLLLLMAIAAVTGDVVSGKWFACMTKHMQHWVLQRKQLQQLYAELKTGPLLGW